MNYRYCVITELPSGGSRGNMAHDLAYPTGEDGGLGPLYTTEYDSEKIDSKEAAEKLIQVESPVFEQGEIVVINEYGREVCGKGRKPKKWSVGYEVYESIDDAVARARQVSEWVTAFGDAEGGLPDPKAPPVETVTVAERHARTAATIEKIKAMTPEELEKLPLAQALRKALGGENRVDD
jgi:hypothetical protein